MERKLTTRNITGLTSPQIAKLGKEKDTPLYTVIGRATGWRANEHPQYGMSYGIRGQFEATNLDTGEVKSSAVFWPPAYLAEQMVAGIDDAKEMGGGAIQFALRVGVKPSDSSPVGYEYYASEIVKVEESDPLADLRKAAQAALPAPEKSDKKEGKKDA